MTDGNGKTSGGATPKRLCHMCGPTPDTFEVRVPAHEHIKGLCWPCLTELARTGVLVQVKATVLKVGPPPGGVR